MFLFFQRNKFNLYIELTLIYREGGTAGGSLVSHYPLYRADIHIVKYV